MYPDSGWPLTKTEVEFLRRMRDEEGFAWAGYRAVCLPGFKTYRKNKPMMSGKAMKGLENRSMLIRDHGRSWIMKRPGQPELELYIMTYEAGKVLEAWDEHEKRAK